MVESMDINLAIRNEHGTKENLSLIESNKGIETLGVHIARNGDMDNQWLALEKKISKWVSAMASRKLLSYETLLCTNTTIYKTIEYPLLISTFSEIKCKRLIKPVHNLALARARIYRRIPNTIKYRPRNMLGLGFHNIYHTQGIEKIEAYLTVFYKVHFSSTLIQTNYELALLHVGIGDKNLFDLEFKRFGILLLRLWIRTL